MIHIVKPKTPPLVLRTQGRAAAQEHCKAHDRGEAIEIKDRIYRDASVKTALLKAQHDKCAFCESWFKHVGYGDVEHFRPKAGHKQQDSDPLHRPGYYWLAYSWDNLFCSCQLCNQRFKRNLFPLQNAAKRVLSHQDHGRLRYEKPLLLDPGKDEPSAFLTFQNDTARALNDNVRGKTTIELLGLNRIDLVEIRGRRLELALLMAETRRVLLRHSPKNRRRELASHLERLNARLQALQADDAEYAAMMRAALAEADAAPSAP